MNKRQFFAAILVIVSIPYSAAVAQDHGPPAGGSDRNLRDSASDVKGRSNEIERVTRDAKKPESRRSENSPAPAPAPDFEQIKGDFERIQIINADVLQAPVPSGGHDYERISESASELNNRAIRLRSNLFPPKPSKESKEKQPQAEEQDLKSLLSSLDDSINSFAHSPMFQNTKVVTPEDSATAQKNLDAIIKISARIRNEADRRKKPGVPPE
jgi:hypothetical protein